MKFKNWIEGFGVDYSQLPIGSDIENLQKSRKTADMEAVYQSNAITFNPEDRPEDFIKINQLNSLQPLNIAKRLPSFVRQGATPTQPTEDVSVLYGLQFTTSGEKITKAASDEIKLLKSKLREMKSQLDIANSKSGISKAAQDIISKELTRLRSKGAPDKMLPQLVNQELKAIDKKPLTPTMIMRFVAVGDAGEETDSSYILRKQIKNVKDEIAALEKKIENKPRFLNIIEQAFLKKIKFPQTPQDKQLQDNFVQLAVQNYTRMRPNYPYDYVVYPQSRSQLNSEIAGALARHYGVSAIQGFQKLANPTIDTTNYIKANPTMDVDTRQSALNLLQKSVTGSKGQIKNIKISDTRPYVRNWEMNPNLSQQVDPMHSVSGLTNRRILLIDDNVASSGTFQAINKVLQQQQTPKSVHIYSPLYVNFSY